MSCIVSNHLRCGLADRWGVCSTGVKVALAWLLGGWRLVLNGQSVYCVRCCKELLVLECLQRVDGVHVRDYDRSSL